MHAITGVHHFYTVSVSVHSSMIVFSCLQRPLASYQVTEYPEPCGLLSENERKVKYVSELNFFIRPRNWDSFLFVCYGGVVREEGKQLHNLTGIRSFYETAGNVSDFENGLK